MKALRFILGLIYLLLIAALILLNKRPQPVYDDDDDEEEEEEDVRRADEWGDGKLKITLLWDFEGDLDLHVTEPGGFEIGWIEEDGDGHLEQESPNGGTLDHDDRNGGRGAGENIFWEEPARGTYRVEVVYFYRRDEGPAQGNCKVVVQKEGARPKTYRVKVDAPDITTDPPTRHRKFVANVKVN